MNSCVKGYMEVDDLILLLIYHPNLCVAFSVLISLYLYNYPIFYNKNVCYYSCFCFPSSSTSLTLTRVGGVEGYYNRFVCLSVCTAGFC